jgi:tripartite-type tricarboxylate transporter receptor subunit TctC
LKRAPALPDVPTAGEQGLADFAVSGWYALVAPAKTPRPIIDRIHAEAAKALKNEAVMQRLATSGSIPIGDGPDVLARHIRTEIERWNRVLTAAGVQPTN